MGIKVAIGTDAARIKSPAGKLHERENMNISGTATVAALAGYQTGESPLEGRVALLKAAQEQEKAQAGQLLEVIESAGQSPSSGDGLDTYA